MPSFQFFLYVLARRSHYPLKPQMEPGSTGQEDCELRAVLSENSSTAVPASSCPCHNKAGWSWGPHQSQYDGIRGAVSSVGTAPWWNCCDLQQPAWGSPALLMHISFIPPAPKDCAGRWGLSKRHSSGHSFKCEIFAAQCQAASAFVKKSPETS